MGKIWNFKDQAFYSSWLNSLFLVKCFEFKCLRVSLVYPTQFKLVLPTAAVGTFPFYDVWFNLV